ncbi:MAG: ABC transporter permease subunit [Lachnospiraceae bacterium]|nr:ABC transporter permease subunit [Lachnospiraceae bacterium]
MRTLISYEMKKILMKKSTIVTFLLLLMVQILLAISGRLGATYVEDTFYETHVERNRIERENGVALSGRPMDDMLFAEMQAAYAKVDWESGDYKWTEAYRNEARKYEDVERRLKLWGLAKGHSVEHITEEVISRFRLESQEKQWAYYELSDREIAYWEDKDGQVALPFIYEYSGAYDSIVSMNGCYMTCMLVTFFIAISMVSVFADEHIRKTDQLILCTRNGRTQVYGAKLLAGSGVVFGVNLIFTGIELLGKFFSYGTEGFDATIQSVIAPWYSYPLSMGQALMLLVGLLLLSSLMVAIFAMLLAEILRNSLGAMAVIVGLLFAARLIPISPALGGLSRAWNYLPINLLKMDQGFLDVRLVNLFGLRLTSWQFAPVLYLLIILLLVLVGSKIYQKFQVSGR